MKYFFIIFSMLHFCLFSTASDLFILQEDNTTWQLNTVAANKFAQFLKANISVMNAQAIILSQGHECPFYNQIAPNHIYNIDYDIHLDFLPLYLAEYLRLKLIELPALKAYYSDHDNKLKSKIDYIKLNYTALKNYAEEEYENFVKVNFNLLFINLYKIMYLRQETYTAIFDNLNSIGIPATVSERNNEYLLKIKSNFSLTDIPLEFHAQYTKSTLLEEDSAYEERHFATTTLYDFIIPYFQKVISSAMTEDYSGFLGLPFLDFASEDIFMFDEQYFDEMINELKSSQEHQVFFKHKHILPGAIFALLEVVENQQSALQEFLPLIENFKGEAKRRKYKTFIKNLVKNSSDNDLLNIGHNFDNRYYFFNQAKNKKKTLDRMHEEIKINNHKKSIEQFEHNKLELANLMETNINSLEAELHQSDSAFYHLLWGNIVGAKEALIKTRNETIKRASIPKRNKRKRKRKNKVNKVNNDENNYEIKKIEDKKIGIFYIDGHMIVSTNNVDISQLTGDLQNFSGNKPKKPTAHYKYDRPIFAKPPKDTTFVPPKVKVKIITIGGKSYELLQSDEKLHDEDINQSKNNKQNTRNLKINTSAIDLDLVIISDLENYFQDRLRNDTSVTRAYADYSDYIQYLIENTSYKRGNLQEQDVKLLEAKRAKILLAQLLEKQHFVHNGSVYAARTYVVPSSLNIFTIETRQEFDSAFDYQIMSEDYILPSSTSTKEDLARLVEYSESELSFYHLHGAFHQLPLNFDLWQQRLQKAQNFLQDDELLPNAIEDMYLDLYIERSRTIKNLIFSGMTIILKNIVLVGAQQMNYLLYQWQNFKNVQIQ